MDFLSLNLKNPVEPFADEVSRYIFNHYLAQIPHQNRVNTRLLSKTRIVDSSPATLTHEPAVFGEFIHKIANRKVQIISKFEPDESANMTFGLSAMGLRYLHQDLPKVRNDLRRLVRELKSRSYQNKGKIYWPHFVRDKKGRALPFINMGLPKGIGGVIVFLSLCYANKIEKDLCLELIEGAIRTILWVDKASGQKGLPAGWGYLPYQNKHSQSWMYGDLTVGYLITVAGIRCNQPKWTRDGMKLFSRGLDPKHIKAPVKTCNFMFGGAGISHLAHRFYQLTGKKEALLAANIWREATHQKFLSFSPTHELKEFEKNPGITPSLLNSSLGLHLVNWHFAGLIDAKWDSVFGLSNPSTGEII